MIESAFSLLFDVPQAKSVDEVFFVAALKNALFASGSTHPNPSVGAVIVKDGRIIAHGHTEKPGQFHAEKQAIAGSKENLQGSTLYVTLEPCCHKGRTPPCTDAIIKAGCARVVYGAQDPNPLVAGKGIFQLKIAQIEVEQIQGALRERAEQFLNPFRSFIERKRPHVIAKVATSKEGFIAEPGQRTKITGEDSDRLVHELRRAVDAVMVGGSTVRIDNPRLTARLGSSRHGQQPIRIIVSKTLDFDPSWALFAVKEAPTWIICPSSEFSVEKTLKRQGVEIIKLPLFSLASVFEELGQRGITSVLVEPGKRLFENLLAEQLLDELWWFKAPHSLGVSGLSIKESLDQVISSSSPNWLIGSDKLTIRSFSLYNF